MSCSTLSDKEERERGRGAKGKRIEGENTECYEGEGREETRRRKGDVTP